MSQLLKGQPNNLTNENCNSMYASSGKWHDYNCDRPQHFICEKTGKILQNQQFKRNFDLIKSKYLNNYHNETSQIFISGFFEDPPVNGGWTEFGSYGPCSVSCGEGTRTRSRTCTNPAPQKGGADCVGSSNETSSCHQSACPSTYNTLYITFCRG